MRPETFIIRTFGCQMNLHDSDRMAQLLMAAGMCPVDEPRHAGLIIINTCSVRAKPEHKALSEAGRYKHARRDRGALVVLAGCVARQEGQKLLDQADFLDAVVGPDAIGRLPAIVDALVAGDGPLLAIEDHDLDDPRFVPLGADTKAGVGRFVTVMKGCNNFCSYCIVPHVRGREVSKPLTEVLAEVQDLAARGVAEVTLLGQNVNSYRDPHSGVGFADLLRDLEAQTAVDRIRFTTSHPKDLGEDLMAAMAECGRVMEHLHLAMQSGSNRILDKMGRGHSRERFIEKAQRLRELVPSMAITTDLIVGFPTETEADFEDTLDAVEQVAFDGAFSFKYSPRPGTLAAKKYPDEVGDTEKQNRLERLHSVLNRLEKNSLNKLEGLEMEVMVEGSSTRDPAAWAGRTRCNRVVNFVSQSALSPGALVRVQIQEARGHTLQGAVESGD